MDEDPVVVVAARGERGKCIRDGLGARRTAAMQGFHAWQRVAHPAKVRVVRRQRNDDRIERERAAHAVDRAFQERLAGQIGVLLGQAAAEAAAAARSGDQRDAARGHSGLPRSSRSAMRSSSSDRNPIRS